jgi:hypothetical protein
MTELELVDLVRDGGEGEALREHLSLSLYPELADHVEDVQKAIVLCTCGLWDVPIEVAGREAPARVHVAALDLEPYVFARLAARAN